MHVEGEVTHRKQEQGGGNGSTNKLPTNFGKAAKQVKGSTRQRPFA